MPRISVLTPTRNSARFIEANLGSVIAQRVPSVEHIIFDDCSQDSTVQIVRLYQERYPHIRLFSEPDTGQSSALNKALAVATGDVIAWLNSDDYYESGAFETVDEVFRGSPAVSVVIGDAVFVDEHGRRVTTRVVGGFTERKLRQGCFVVQPSVFFRRSVVGSHFLDERLHFAMDYDLWLRVMTEGNTTYVGEVLSYFRLHRGSKTYATTPRAVWEYYLVKSRHRCLSARDLIVLPYVAAKALGSSMRLTVGSPRHG